jgi:hypothetical protein
VLVHLFGEDADHPEALRALLRRPGVAISLAHGAGAQPPNVIALDDEKRRREG